MRYLALGLFFIIATSLCGCGDGADKTDSAVKPVEDRINSTSASSPVSLDSKNFEGNTDGKPTNLYILKNRDGLKLFITNYGGRIVALTIPGKDGKDKDVVVGFKTVADYASATEPYFGATIGRYGNRIAKGKFSLDGKEYTLFTNNGPNTLHGGKKGYQYVVWDTKAATDSTLELTYRSKDGEEGFPGNLDINVRFSLTEMNELKIDYHATTDKKTVVNLTNHAFFNLNGEGSGDVLQHNLQIDADKFTPVDSTLIPLGRLEQVAGTPFDFRKATTIGARIGDSSLQLKNGGGYDHNFILNGKGMKHAATVTGDKSGIIMDVFTDEPGLQFYSGNFMQSKNIFKGGSKDDYRTAFCLETQHYPDSPNQLQFPSTVLKPGQIYSTRSIYKFSLGK